MPQKKLTEQEKAERAEARRKAKEQAEKEAKETTSSTEIDALKEQNEALQRQVKEMLAMMQDMQRPQVVQVATDVAKVHLRWQAEVANDNVQTFGDGGRLGRVVGKRGDFYMPKSDFTTIIDERMQFFLDNRWLIVLEGLTDDEREAYGVNYKEGEILDRKAFDKLVELGDKILEIYPNLCEGHRRMVAQRFFEAYQNNSPYVTRDIVVALNKMSKSEKYPRGEFIQIIEGLNAKDAGDE